MVGINKSINTKTLQTTKTAKVDTVKTTGTQKAEAQKQAVWILKAKFTGNGQSIKIPGAKTGDKVIMLGPDNTYAIVEILECREDGTGEAWGESRILIKDIEAHRGDITNPEVWDCWGGW